MECACFDLAIWHYGARLDRLDSQDIKNQPCPNHRLLTPSRYYKCRVPDTSAALVHCLSPQPPRAHLIRRLCRLWFLHLQPWHVLEAAVNTALIFSRHFIVYRNMNWPNSSQIDSVSQIWSSVLESTNRLEELIEKNFRLGHRLTCSTLSFHPWNQTKDPDSFSSNKMIHEDLLPAVATKWARLFWSLQIFGLWDTMSSPCAVGTLSF